MTGGALDADPQDVHLQARQPLLACGQSGVGVVKAGSVDLDPGWVDNRDRHRQLVRIDAYNSVLCHAEPPVLATGTPGGGGWHGIAGFSRTGSFQASADPATQRRAQQAPRKGQRNGEPRRRRRAAR